MNERISLPARFDGASVEVFTRALAERSARPLTIEAQAVSYAGALGVQALIAAWRQWRADGVAFRVEGMNDGLHDICRVLGIDPREFGAADDMGDAK